MNTPKVDVGIYSPEAFSFVLNGEFQLSESAQLYSGEHNAAFADGEVFFDGKKHKELLFSPTSEDCSFDLKDVIIGVDFHWQRKEDQRFKGALKVEVFNSNQLSVINQVDIESYLCSVISSEMSATSSKELLKTHAIISRSWLLAQIEKNQELSKDEEEYQSTVSTENSFIKWYDREDHTTFDVCADDHCQRYQGITRASTPMVSQVIDETRGEVLAQKNGKLCDARFSKCCGGVTEVFETCWEPVSHPYLVALKDAASTDFSDLTIEKNAEEWIKDKPDVFCNTSDKRILSQVLNNYDQETSDFFRWEVSYSQAELSALIRRKSGIDFGDILDIIPIKRGPSSRLEQMEVVGTKKRLIIGKELEIRRILSESHLYSSAFLVDKEELESGIPKRFVLRGAGWGHGVGLCQIGAAVMSEKGYTYQQILQHYFPGSILEKRY